MRNRIKFYGINDMSVHFQKRAICDFISNVDDDYDAHNANSIIELVNLNKFMHEPRFWGSLLEKDKSEYISKKSFIFSAIHEYFSCLDAEALKDALETVEDEYMEDFLDEYSKNCLDRISEEDFYKAWIESGRHQFYLFKNKKLVEAYSKICKELFLADSRNVEFLLDNYIDSRVYYVIPDLISKDEIYSLCLGYIGSDFANPKYLDIIQRRPNGLSDRLVIDADLLLLVRRRIAEIEDKLADMNGIRMEQRFAIYSKKEAYDEALHNRRVDDIVLFMDEEWIRYDHSASTILNNLRYLYDFFNPDMIFAMPSFPNLEMGIVDIFGSMKTKRHYPCSILFDQKQHLGICKMSMLEKLLMKNGVGFVDIVKWFYREYCLEYFDIKWLNFPSPLNTDTLSNKTSILFRSEENIRKQYYTYCTKGEINEAYMQCIDTPALNNLLSLDKRPKYAYFAKNSTLMSYAQLLFSTQSGLGIANNGIVEDNLYKLMEKHTIHVDDFCDYQRLLIDKLLKNNVISIHDNGLGLGDLVIVQLLYRLYYIGTLCLWYLDDDELAMIERWKDDNLIIYDNTLFSKPEIDYLNYVLNNSSFDNSLALRNKYQHGFEASADITDELLFDYYMALLVHILYIMKIHDELFFRLPETEKVKFNCEIVDGY